MNLERGVVLLGLLDLSNPDRTNLQLRRIGDRVVAATGQLIHRDVGEGEGGEDGAAGGAVGEAGLDLDFAAAGGHGDELAVGDPPGLGVSGVDLQRFFIEEVVDALAAAGLGAAVVALEASAGGEPDGILVIDDFGGVAVADDLEQSSAILEFLFVQARCPGVIFGRDRPLVLAVLDAVPVEARVDRTQRAELVEDLLGTFL